MSEKYGKSFGPGEFRPNYESVSRCRKCGGTDIQIDISNNKRICQKCKTDEFIGSVNYNDIQEKYQEELNKVDERIPEGYPAPKL